MLYTFSMMRCLLCDLDEEKRRNGVHTDQNRVILCIIELNKRNKLFKGMGELFLRKMRIRLEHEQVDLKQLGVMVIAQKLFETFALLDTLEIVMLEVGERCVEFSELELLRKQMRELF
jgi:hypothetical protein